MDKLNFTKILPVIVACVLLSACSKEKQWKVEGTIAGAEGKTIVLEGANDIGWYLMDSLQLDKSGKFSFEQNAIPSPDIFRLRIDNATFYFPVDSTETVTLNGNLANPSDYTISGNNSAEMMMAAEKAFNKYSAAGGNIAKNPRLKEELWNIIDKDPANIVAYYIIHKQINGRPVYDLTNRDDVKVIGAVANAFNEQRPDDPRTKALAEAFTEIKRYSKKNIERTSVTPKDTIYAPQIMYLDISLYDNTGKLNELKQTVDKNKIVLVSFTRYDQKFSTPYNIELNKAYDKYHEHGLEIYQVGIDQDDFQWTQSAKNLPWITVYNPPTGTNEALIDYNITQVPVTFVIAEGELRERIDNPADIEAAVAKYF